MSKAPQPNMTESLDENGNEIKYTIGATDVGIFPRGSSDTVWTNAGGGGENPEGPGEDIFSNEITGDRAPKRFHNFSNTDKTTKEEDYCVTSNIHENSITAENGAKRVGMFNFQNTNLMRNVSQGQGGREGRKDFPNPNPSGIGHNIFSNYIRADGSEKVGYNNFGNTLFRTGDDRQPPKKIAVVPATLIQQQKRGRTLDLCANEIDSTNATDVGMSNFNNRTDHTGQGGATVTQNGRNIKGNKIKADGGKRVGLSNFDNHLHKNSGGKKSPA